MIHPEIKEYWESRGYRVDEDEFNYDNGNIGWGAFSDSINGSCFTIALWEKETLKVIYWGFGLFGHSEKNHWYSEEEMLKIIRMKAFL